MSKVSLTHQVIGVERFLNVAVVDTDGHTHQHVLRSFSDHTVEFQKVRTLKGLETKVVVVVITLVIDVIVENLGVCHDDFIHFFGNEGSMLVGFWVDVFSQVSDDVGEHILGRTVQVINANTCCKTAVIGVVRCEGGRCFSSELVKLTCGNSIVEAFDGKFGNVAWVNPSFVQPFGQNS